MHGIFANGIQGQSLLTFADAPLPLSAHFISIMDIVGTGMIVTN